MNWYFFCKLLGNVKYNSVNEKLNINVYTMRKLFVSALQDQDIVTDRYNNITLEGFIE